MCYKYFKNRFKIKKRTRSLINNEINFQTINGECSICLDILDIRSSIIMLDCNHIFHEKCIDDHTNYGHNFCPYCMKKISKNSYILL